MLKTNFKNLILWVFMLHVTLIFAQVGIGNEDPKATLDVNKTSYSANEPAGIAVTQQTAAQIESMTTTDLKAGTLVYATTGTGSLISSIGYWYWDGTTWVKSDASSSWSINGNAGTDGGNSNFIGTTDNTDVVVKRNNEEFMRFNDEPWPGGILKRIDNQLFSTSPQSAITFTMDGSNKSGGFADLSVQDDNYPALSIRNTTNSNFWQIAASLNTKLSIVSQVEGKRLMIFDKSLGKAIIQDDNFTTASQQDYDAPSAVLELNSKTKGFLPPRMTSVEMNAVATPAEGLTIYCYDCPTEGLHTFDGTDWNPVSSSSENIYTADGSLLSNRTVAQGNNTLAFTSTATTGTSHFNVDESTFNVDAVNNRVGINNLAPTASLDVISDPSLNNITNPIARITTTTQSSNENYGLNFRNAGGAYIGYIGSRASTDGTSGLGLVGGSGAKDINFYTETTLSSGNASDVTSTGNSLRMTVKAVTGRVGIGTSNPASALSIVSNGAGGSNADDVEITSYNSTPGTALLFKSSRGTQAAPQNLTNGNIVGFIGFQGRANGTFQNFASINSNYKGNGTTSLADLNFSTVGTVRMVLDENGDLGINNLAGTGTRMVVANAAGVLSTQAVPAGADGSETIVTAGTNVTVTGAGTTASPYVIDAAGAADATTTTNGIVRLAGDLSGTAAAPTIANNAITSSKIADGAIEAADLNQMSATSGQVLAWNGTSWAPATSTVNNIYSNNGTLSSERTVAQAGNNLIFSGAGNLIKSGGAFVQGDYADGDKLLLMNSADAAKIAHLPGWIVANYAGSNLSSAPSGPNIGSFTWNTTNSTNDGWTERMALNSNGDLYATGSFNFGSALMPNNLPGTAGQVLTSSGAGVAPVWSDVSSLTSNIYTADGSLLGNRKISTASNTLHIAGNGAQASGNVTSILDIDSNEKGLLIPRLTNAERVAISNPANGLMLYNTTNRALEFYDATRSSWARYSAGGAFFNETATATGAVVGLNFTRTNGTLDAPAAVTTHRIGVLNYEGYDGASNISGLRMEVVTDGPVTTGSVPMSMRFDVMTQGSTARTTMLMLKSTGNVGISTNNPTERLHVVGNVRFTGALMPNNSAGAAGQVLTSAGAGLPPTWTSIASTEADGIIGNEVTDATLSGGLVRAGAGTAVSPFTLGVATGGISTAMIADGSVTALKINQMGATTGQVLTWNGTIWAPSASTFDNIYTSNGTLSGNRVVTQGSNTLAFTSSVINGFSVDGSTFSVDALNNRVGLGLTEPTERLDISGNFGITGNINQKGVSGVLDINPNQTLRVGRLSNSPSFGFSILRGNSGLFTAHSFNGQKNSFVAVGTLTDVDGVDLGTPMLFGVGTSNPIQKLDVVGNVRLTGALMPNNLPGIAGQVLTSSGAGVAPVWSDVSSLTSNIYSANGSLSGNRTVSQGTNSLSFTSTATTGVNQFNVDGTTFSVNTVDNRVGIGTTSPGAPLHVSVDAHDRQILVGKTGNSGKISFSRASDGFLTGSIGYNGQTEVSDFSIQNSTGNGFISFYTNNTGALSERMRITGSGSVGIGTNAPTERLHVVGGNVRVDNGSRLVVSASGSVTSGINDVFALALNSTNGLVFETASTERMKILSNGNVGIGTSTPTSTNQINGTFALNTATSGTANSVVLLASGTFTPPAASTVSGRIYIIRNTSASTDVIVDTIVDYGATSAANFTLTPATGAVTIISDGTSWFRIQ